MGFVFSSKPEQKIIPHKIIGKVGEEKYMECNGSSIDYTNIKNLEFVRGMDSPTQKN